MKFVMAGIPFWLLLCLTTASAQTGWGIGAREGHLYFSDLDRGRVLKLDPQGGLHVLIEDVHCHNLAPGYDSSFMVRPLALVVAVPAM